jgi:hypothetical protein
MSRRFYGEGGWDFSIPAFWMSAGTKGHETCDVDLGKPARLSGPYRAKRLFMFTQAKAHTRQDKALVLELKSFGGICSTKDEGIFIFDEPLKVLALYQLNRVG